MGRRELRGFHGGRVEERPKSERPHLCQLIDQASGAFFEGAGVIGLDQTGVDSVVVAQPVVGEAMSAGLAAALDGGGPGAGERRAHPIQPAYRGRRYRL
ncbi:hypothetical protein CcI49_11470 [Frankia sp. CcI49]|nr:hypothetical protein CcI49_11470 [Frankia sp. CcI49]